MGDLDGYDPRVADEDDMRSAGETAALELGRTVQIDLAVSLLTEAADALRAAHYAEQRDAGDHMLDQEQIARLAEVASVVIDAAHPSTDPIVGCVLHLLHLARTYRWRMERRPIDGRPLARMVDRRRTTFTNWGDVDAAFWSTSWLAERWDRRFAALPTGQLENSLDQLREPTIGSACALLADITIATGALGELLSAGVDDDTPRRRTDRIRQRVSRAMAKSS